MLKFFRVLPPIKRFLPLLGAPMLGLALFGANAPAQEVDGASARLDRLQTSIDGLQLKLQGAKLQGAKLQVAQGYGYGRPPGNVGDAEDGYNPPPRQDAAGLDVRIGHIEEQMRQMTGQIEQMQFAQRKLEEQLKKFQQDVDFRFQDTSHGGAAPRTQKRTEAPESETGVSPSPSSTTANASNDFSPSGMSASAVPLHGSHRGDAFDPASDPTAPGAPRQLGSIASSATALPPPATPKVVAESHSSTIIMDDEADPDAPLDLSGRHNGPASSTPPGNGISAAAPLASAPLSSTPASSPPGFGTAAAPRQIPLTAPQTTPASSTPAPATMAAIAPVASPKEEFDAALGYLRQKEYENAEKGFSAFLQKNPKNRMTADAVYYLGETYFQRGRQREAAEQYLKISTNYSTSAHAPEAMLRLGLALYALGAKEQACATFDEVPRKYPNAAAAIKANAEKEAQRVKC
jgi:tol-pal system protein YbgF